MCEELKTCVGWLRCSIYHRNELSYDLFVCDLKHQSQMRVMDVEEPSKCPHGELPNVWGYVV